MQNKPEFCAMLKTRIEKLQTKNLSKNKKTKKNFEKLKNFNSTLSLLLRK